MFAERWQRQDNHLQEQITGFNELPASSAKWGSPRWREATGVRWQGVPGQGRAPKVLQPLAPRAAGDTAEPWGCKEADARTVIFSLVI